MILRKVNVNFSSFHFNDMRIDEALRTFLETFRLPGEAPVIQHILEVFSEGYFVSCEAGPLLNLRMNHFTITTFEVV